MLYVCHSTRWIERTVTTHANKRDEETKKTKNRDTFPKWNINMTIQPWFLTKHVLTCLLYVAKRWVKSIDPTCCPTPKTQQVEHWKHLRKTSDSFSRHQPGCHAGTRERLCLFRFICKGFHSCIVYNSLVWKYQQSIYIIIESTTPVN